MPAAPFLAFWGKARPRDDASPGSPEWHPVAYHVLDVAAVTQAILAARPLALARGARLLGLEPHVARPLLVVLAALHDLGKFAPAFQAKSPCNWPDVLGPLGRHGIVPTHHTADGYALWCGALGPRVVDRLWCGARGTLDLLAPAVFGHHGRPLRSDDGRRSIASLFPAPALDAAIACAEALVSLLHPEPVDAPPPSDERATLAGWWVAGLLTVADWIGSNERWFPYAAPDLDLTAYWSLAGARAGRAVREAGLASPRPAARVSFTELTGIAKPSPAQRWASDAPFPDGPLLVILEDVTGAGKTEAAQMLVHRLMADGRAAGAYWAMPTMATANAMYARQAEAIDALFARDGREIRPSLALAHGQTRLHEGFRATVLRGEDQRLDAASNATPGLPAEAACAAFLADDRRAALLADVGAGTVDQALLGALPSRFNTVRLFGMADKVLVFDEAHAYDAYMGVEAQQLLRFQAALGGSAVVLSATLSLEQREQFASAWADGVADGQRRTMRPGWGAPPPLVRSMEYPLATVVAGGGAAREDPVEAAPWSSRSVAVRFVRSEEEACAHVVEAARRGAAVAWVRNTVDDCLAAAAAVRAAGIEPMVFHARFAQCDRQAIEQRVLALLGKQGSAADRQGAVLACSPVFQESLDADVDVLVTDLAPVDLLIQRAGRLQRHPERNGERPNGTPRELVVLAPPTDAEPARDWLTALLPRTRHVYEDVGALWRTAVALGEAGAIVTPEGLRPLIEAVYGSEVPPPDALLPVAQAAEGKEFGNAAAAQLATLEVTDGYLGDQKGWVDDVKPLTRLSDAQTTVRLARVLSNGTLAPWATTDGPAWKAWALSEVRLRGSRVPFGSTAAPEYEAAVGAVRGEWGKFEQEITVLPLVERAGEPGVFEGTLVRPKDGVLMHVRYGSYSGVEYGEGAH